jgi:oxygen-independent coproporphyrinogen-3 oxidase
MHPLRADAMGLYISVPFCRSKCTYCNFASGVYPASEHARYVERLVQEMEAAPACAEGLGVDLPSVVDTVYLGGGTPSLLEPQLFDRLFNAIRHHFFLAPEAEITVECAPGQLPDATLAAMVAAGVNRVSLGVQSLVDREAQVSGRLHTRAIVLKDLHRLRSAGVHNVNLDLIVGLAGQTATSWDESLVALLETGVPHASIYMLEVDEDSRLGRELLSGGARYFAELVPTDDAIAQMYETAMERLENAGLRQYEISNFARPGYTSQHNLRYWQRRPYLGLGLDASSALYARQQDGSGTLSSALPFLLRTKTTEDLRDFLAGGELAEFTWLSVERQLEEAWFLGLRLTQGVDVDALRRQFGPELIAQTLMRVDRLVSDGLLESDSQRVWLSRRGRLLSNEVFQEFLFESV